MLAIPPFANGQRISCTVCHTSFPGMKPYGMMTMMMNFQNLQYHLQTGALPFAIHAEIDGYLSNKQNAGQTYVSTFSLLGGGFIGRNVTWYAEQPFVDTGQPGITEQLWLSWNGLLHGSNSIQVGKYHTPFPFMPAHGFTIGDYLLATQTTGQNAFAPNDSHWGIAFNGMSNEFMYNAAYLTSDAGIGGALDYNRVQSPQVLDLNVAYGGMEVPYTIGLTAMRGTAPLTNARGAYAGGDPFTREGLYVSYQKPSFQIQTMYYGGYDQRADIGAFATQLRGFFFEYERDLGWRNHIVARYDVAYSDALNRQYIFDLVHHFAPNMKITGEIAMGPHAEPRFGFRFGWAGPWIQRPATMPYIASPENVPAPLAKPVDESPAARGAMAYEQQGCASCHGAHGEGGIGPPLAGLATRLSGTRIADSIAHPRGIMPDYHLAATTIDDIVTFIQGLAPSAGATPSPGGS